MKIVDERLKTTQFYELQVGDMFFYEYAYYIVIGHGRYPEQFNAVELMTGELFKFDDKENVEKLDDVQITIK